MFGCVSPLMRSIVWFLQDQQLFNNQASGVIITNQSLVLQSVTKERSGLYTCVGHNQEGDGQSHPVHLDIKCKPKPRTIQLFYHPAFSCASLQTRPDKNLQSRQRRNLADHLRRRRQPQQRPFYLELQQHRGHHRHPTESDIIRQD